MHTPGPWTVNGPYHIEAHTEPTDRRENGEFIPPSRKIVAHVINGHGIAADEKADNAQLIAAAPDLLEACRHLLQRLNGAKLCGGQERQMLKDAINKAVPGSASL